MKEFNKIYIAKYFHLLTIRQLAEDLHSTNEEVNVVLREMRENEMLFIYKNIAEEEWEELERLSDDEIRFKYYKKSKIIQKKALQSILNAFKVNQYETINSFPKFRYTKCDFDKEYMQEKDFEGEEWKQIYNLNYEISNYGRIKNKTTKKLKKLKHQIYGMQVLLWQNSKSYTITVSRLVAEMFIRHLEKDERATHIDGNAKNNYYKNLKIVSK